MTITTDPNAPPAAVKPTKQFWKGILHGSLIGGSVLFLVTIGFIEYEVHKCEAFWKENCTVVAAPSSIQPMFTQQWYDKYNDSLQSAGSSQVPPSPATVSAN